MNTSHQHHFGAILHEPGVFALSGGSVTQNKAVCIILGLVYVKQNCWCHLEAQIGELRLLGAQIGELRLLVLFRGSYMQTRGVASSGGLVMWKEAGCIIWRLLGDDTPLTLNSNKVQRCSSARDLRSLSHQ